MRDNLSADAPHNKYREELDHPEVLVLYAFGAVILLMVIVFAIAWWL